MPTALLTQTDTLLALEELAAGARHELILAFRSFDPETPLHSARLRELGLVTWSDLIPWLTRRGVHLHMAFGDDDPLLDPERHRRAWLAASGFANVAQGDAQILCAPHGQTAGAVWRWRFIRPRRRRMAALKAAPPEHLTILQRQSLEQKMPLRTQHVHHAFAVADGEEVVIGGFTLDEHRPASLWQDVALRLSDADFAGALRAHFADCWTAAIQTGAPTLATPPQPFRSVARRLSRPERRLLRTLSDPKTGPFRISGTPREQSFETHICRLLSDARQHVYIETAALRHRPYADALIAAAKAAPELQLVVVFHPAGDRLPLGGALRETRERGQALQTEQLQRLSKAFGSRAAFVEHHLPGDLTADGAAPLPGRLIIVDGTYAVVGSHDLTARAAKFDSQASILIRDPAFAGDLMGKRSAMWLGQGRDVTRAASWANATAPLRPLAVKPGRMVPARIPDDLF
ncbi:phospholipase D-like domain-containing protein [Sagittula sp. SSi028]|uniref:phospholipase D-like domain-containing protein n=1 Tax=Sagittula sp. SSi028 TaxID=3400636 RepID=UPI003AF51F40